MANHVMTPSPKTEKSARRTQNSSEESNAPSELFPGSTISIPTSPTCTGTETRTPDIKVPSAISEGLEMEEVPHSRPTLWSPLDRPGRAGVRDRHMRNHRLARSISLTLGNIKDLLQFMWDNYEGNKVHWSDDIVFQFLPRQFEEATIPAYVGGSALRTAITLALRRHFPR